MCLFLLGLFTGSTIGSFIIALCVVAKEKEG